MRIRVVKTASDKQAIQVVSKRHDKLTVHKHIGSYANQFEKQKLYLKAVYVRFRVVKRPRNSFFHSSHNILSS